MGKPKAPRSAIVVLGAAVTAIALLFLLSSMVSTNNNNNGSPNSNSHVEVEVGHSEKKYVYWGTRIDCPGKHCGSCEGLGHQESSLRCALEEAIFLRRYIYNISLITPFSVQHFGKKKTAFVMCPALWSCLGLEVHYGETSFALYSYFFGT